MATIELNEYSTARDLTDAALQFAADRIERARSLYGAKRLHETPRHAALRRKFAARVLRESQAQINAAIALLEMED